MAAQTKEIDPEAPIWEIKYDGEIGFAITLTRSHILAFTEGWVVTKLKNKDVMNSCKNPFDGYDGGIDEVFGATKYLAKKYMQMVSDRTIIRKYAYNVLKIHPKTKYRTILFSASGRGYVSLGSLADVLIQHKAFYDNGVRTGEELAGGLFPRDVFDGGWDTTNSAVTTGLYAAWNALPRDEQEEAKRKLVAERDSLSK